MANLSWPNLLTFSAGQIAEWGADGVIIGSAMVKQLGEAASPKEGLQRLEDYARSMKNALPRNINDPRVVQDQQISYYVMKLSD